MNERGGWWGIFTRRDLARFTHGTHQLASLELGRIWSQLRGKHHTSFFARSTMALSLKFKRFLIARMKRSIKDLVAPRHF